MAGKGDTVTVLASVLYVMAECAFYAAVWQETTRQVERRQRGRLPRQERPVPGSVSRVPVREL